MTVLTGETGAGKSILLDAFSLALGARGDGSLVRQGLPQGQVTAVFDVGADHALRAIAAQARRTSTPMVISSCAGCRWRTGAPAPSSTTSR